MDPPAVEPSDAGQGAQGGPGGCGAAASSARRSASVSRPRWISSRARSGPGGRGGQRSVMSASSGSRQAVAGQVDSRADSELAVDRGEIRLHGLCATRTPAPRYLRVRQSGGRELGDLPLCLRQSAERSAPAEAAQLGAAPSPPTGRAGNARQQCGGVRERRAGLPGRGAWPAARCARGSTAPAQGRTARRGAGASAACTSRARAPARSPRAASTRPRSGAAMPSRATSRSASSMSPASSAASTASPSRPVSRSEPSDKQLTAVAQRDRSRVREIRRGSARGRQRARGGRDALFADQALEPGRRDHEQQSRSLLAGDEAVGNVAGPHDDVVGTGENRLVAHVGRSAIPRARRRSPPRGGGRAAGPCGRDPS